MCGRGWKAIRKSESTYLLREVAILLVQCLLRLGMVEVFDDALYWTYLHTLLRIEMAHALATESGIDLIVLGSLVYRIIAALWLTHITVDACVSDQQ
jgi:hypothetical protein